MSLAKVNRSIHAKVAAAKVGFSSKHELYNYLQTAEAPQNGVKATYNEDLLPTPPEHRVWSTIHYFSFYGSTTFSVQNYNLGATLVSIGLLYWHGILAAAIGSFILTLVLVLNSRGPLRYHLGFPAYLRASTGLSGSKFFVCVRAIVACLYFAVQTYYAGRIMSELLFAVFGHGWENIPNTLPASAGITSKNLLAFMIYWMVQFPFMFIHPRHQRWLYVFKSVYTPICLLGVLGWAVSKNGGLGDLSAIGAKKAEGSELVWAMLQAINAVLAALCPILINTADVARYSKRPSDTVWSQFGAIMFSKVLMMFIGIATTSAASGPNVVGKLYWNVWDLYHAILINYWSPAARAGVFFASSGMICSVLAINIGTNALPVGADVSGIFPRWINIRRGQIACALIAPLLVPWKIIASAASFLTFLGSYTVMLMPLCGIMICDYWIIRKGNIHTPSIYNTSPDAIYMFWKGWNLRAVGAWVAGVALTIHGIAGNLKPDSVSQASKNIYKMGFILSGLMGFFTYWALCAIFPIPVVPQEHRQEVLGFEALAASEGFFEGENVSTITGQVIDGEASSDHGSKIITDKGVNVNEKVSGDYV